MTGKKLKRILSILLCIAVSLTMFTMPASAATTRVEWDGKSQMKSGVLYTISSTLTLRKDFTIPEGATLNVRDGATLTFSGGHKLTIRGELAVSIGGTLEIKSGTVDLRSPGKLSIYGNLMHYMNVDLNVRKGTSLNVYNKGYYKGSGNLNIYPEASVSSKGYIIFTTASITTVTGSFTAESKSESHFQGSVVVTTSGTVTNKGYMTVGKNGTIKNSGIFTLAKNSGFNRFGTVSNTKTGVFRDNRDKFEHEDMTVSILVDEPEVKQYGIDVSYAQGNIDWKKVAATGIDFAIIRAARGTVGTSLMKTDDYFVQNIKGASENGIDVGVYFYSYATTVSEARKEAEFLVSVIKDYKITYPVILDMEEEMGDFSVKKITEMVEAFFEVLMDAGYYPMLYSYKHWLETYLDMTILDKYAIWLAQINDTVTYQGGYYIWQYSHTGRVSGISGPVDLNISYRDFPSILKKNKLNQLK